MSLKIKTYLTIDDSPSTRMDDIVDFLSRRDIQGLFFCRGDLLEKNTTSAVRALQKGHILANHAYDHTRASTLSAAQMIEQIEITETLLEDIYDMASVDRPGLFFRFPHLDRGTGSWIIDMNALPFEQRKDAQRALTEGLNQIAMAPPGKEMIEKRDAIQAYLKKEGYTVPFNNISDIWYHCEEVSKARDCLFTFSTCDWMLTRRHLGKWRYQSLEDLRKKIFHEPSFKAEDSTHIVLAHDQNEIADVTMNLIDFMDKSGVEFLRI